MDGKFKKINVSTRLDVESYLERKLNYDDSPMDSIDTNIFYLNFVNANTGVDTSNMNNTNMKNKTTKDTNDKNKSESGVNYEARS